ncbi:MAG: T9SS type A sorting domain-containing protein, partial [Candidatus Cloacimonetes bacterium]|nr:T9SS type A sorting domain-containing protein [Candidatus Cloacimonadota bacterium]
MSLQNTGEITTPDFYTKLVGNYEDLTIDDEYGYYTPIESGDIGVTSDYYTITADNQVLPGAIFNLTLEIYLDLTYQTLFKCLNIPLVVGSPDVDDPLGPDTYGYLCYDDGDIGYDDVPIYDWIDINDIGKPLSEINQEPGNNDLGAFNQVIDLPFNFTFYGIEYDDKLTVSSAGWISFGVQEEEAFYNSPLPGPLGPSPMIAAFWDELDYIDGTSNASYFYDDMYHRFIIEWNNFKNSDSQAEETFQVILFDHAYYPTLSSDGLIKVQYKVIDNDSPDDESCYSSIGLEDHTQSIGLQYTYYNIYPDAAKELEDEMAIFFTTGKNRQQEAMNIPAGQTVELDHLYIENGLINDVYGTLIVNDVLQINNNSTLWIYGNLILESSNLFVLEGSQIILEGTLDLRNGSSVEFIDNSIFQIEAGAIVLGNTPATYPSEIGYVPGDRIIVQDGSYLDINGTSEERVTITSSNLPTCWEGITYKNYYYLPISTFNNCDFSYIHKLNLYDNDADMRVEMNNCNFTNSGQIVVKELFSYKFKGEHGFRCDISQNTATPLIAFGSYSSIENCDISNNNGDGLVIYYPNNNGQSNIINTNIYENNYYGAYFYHAPVYLDNCLIEMNRCHGIMSFHNASPKLKDCTIQNNGNPLYGSNNGVEILATYEAFPLMYKDDPINYTQGMNTIYDEVDGGDSDHYLLWAGAWEPEMLRIPVWGNFFPNSSDPGFTDRFFPGDNTFIFIELPHDPRAAYDTAQSKIIAGNYEDAKIDLKNLISDYPDEDYFVSCSLQWLLFLEKFTGNDYVELRNYVEELSLTEFQEQVMYNIISQTYAQEQNYTEALTRFESIINDPPSAEELIFATIDEGYYYLKAQEQNQTDRGLSFCSVQPKDFTEFMIMLTDLELELNDILSLENPTLVKLTSNNYPNPFNPETTISFDLPQDSKVKITIYNIKGQKIKTLLAGNLAKGTHSVVWNGKDSNNKAVSSGIYFYKLSTGKEKAMKKMLLLK